MPTAPIRWAKRGRTRLRGTGVGDDGEWLSDVLWNGFARARMGAVGGARGQRRLDPQGARAVRRRWHRHVHPLGVPPDEEAARVGTFLIDAR